MILPITVLEAVWKGNGSVSAPVQQGIQQGMRKTGDETPRVIMPLGEDYESDLRTFEDQVRASSALPHAS